MTWIKRAIEEGKRELGPAVNLLAGIGPCESYEPGEMREAILSGRAGGPDGEMLFVYSMASTYLSTLKEVWS